MTMRNIRWTPSLLLVALAVPMGSLGGCSPSYLDPYQKPYVWVPSGAPAANIAAQLVDPHDLVLGRSASEGDGRESAQAIDRVEQDKPKQLISQDMDTGSTAGSSGSGSGSGSGASSGGSN